MEVNRMIYSTLKKMDRWWYENNSSVAHWTWWNPDQVEVHSPELWTNTLRMNPNAVFLDVPVSKGFSDNFAERCIDS